MSKYIRTKDGIGKVGIDFNGDYCVWYQHNWYYLEDLEKDIIKQADTIEELIMPGDLVMVGLTILIVRETMKDELVGHDMGLIRKNAVEVLWIKQGKDFVKCAVKKEGDDYLTLCD